MQINLPDSGTIFFISDHCHVIENVSIAVPGPSTCFSLQRSNQMTNVYLHSGATASLKVGSREITPLGKFKSGIL